MAFRKREQALYAKLADALREQIASGALPPGSVLPSETDLMTTYGVSRPTARNAFTVLRHQGLITVLHGKGAFVRRLDDTRPAHTLPRALTRSPAPAGRRRRSTRTSPTPEQPTYTDADAGRWTLVGEPERSHTDATPALALALVIPEHAPLFVTDRLLADTTGRHQAQRLYLPFTVCAEIPDLETDPHRTPSEVYTLLAAHHGELGWTDHVRARMPTHTEASRLRLPDNAPLFLVQRITHTPDGRPLALDETRTTADDTQLTYRLTAEDKQNDERTSR